MDCSLPGSSVHGIFQAIVLEWIAISFSRLACIGPPQRPTLGWQQFSFFESRMKEAKCGKMIFKSKFLYAVMRENQMYFQGPRNLTHMCFLRKLLAAKSLQSCPTLCDPIDGSPPGSLGFSRKEHWSGLPFPSPMKVKSESEVAQSCPTLSDPMDCSLPGSSIHGIFQARVLE